MAAQTFIGRYEIVAELGRGAMGSVFKATDPAVGRTVALKTIHSAALSGEQSEEYRARFYREARASGVLAHPGIVPVFDVGECDGAPFLVMEFVEGRTLADAIKKGERFTLDRVCEIGQQIADALGYAHRQGVIHRDIKPANILMTSREVYGSERPRITDFGIAKLAASEITTTGQLLGTPSFMPPEQFTGAPIDGRADLFSLGVILYSLATGEQPFPGETMTAVSYKVVYTEPIPPSKLNPAIPAGLEGVILKCLAKNPGNRYQTGEELAQDLATLRANPNATVMRTAMAPSAADPNATLVAAPSSISHPPAVEPAATTQKSRRRSGKEALQTAKNETHHCRGSACCCSSRRRRLVFSVHRQPPRPPGRRSSTLPPRTPQPPPPFGTPDLPPAPAPAVSRKPRLRPHHASRTFQTLALKHQTSARSRQHRSAAQQANPAPSRHRRRNPPLRRPQIRRKPQPRNPLPRLHRPPQARSQHQQQIQDPVEQFPQRRAPHGGDE